MDGALWRGLQGQHSGVIRRRGVLLLGGGSLPEWAKTEVNAVFPEECLPSVELALGGDQSGLKSAGGRGIDVVARSRCKGRSSW